jgi:hypothetical protein
MQVHDRIKSSSRSPLCWIQSKRRTIVLIPQTKAFCVWMVEAQRSWKRWDIRASPKAHHGGPQVLLVICHRTFYISRLFEMLPKDELYECDILTKIIIQTARDPSLSSRPWNLWMLRFRLTWMLSTQFVCLWCLPTWWSTWCFSAFPRCQNDFLCAPEIWRFNRM